MNTAVLIGLSVIIAVLLYVTISVNMESGIAKSLEIYAAQLAGYVEQMSNAQNQETENQRYLEFVESLKNDNIAFIIWDADFQAVDGTDNRPLSDDILLDLTKQVLYERRDFYYISDYQTDTVNLKICTYLNVTDRGELMVTQTMKNMDAERGVLANAIRTIFGVVLAGVALSLLFGYFLSGRSLVPIRENMDRQRDFLANASHELRTPIAVIKTNLEVVKGNGDDLVSSQETWLDNAYGEALRMQNIVEDLMFLAKADTGDIPFDMEPVDIGFLIRDVTERFIPLVAEKGLRILTEVPAEPLNITGDAKQLTQLLVILIDNAIKYTESGGRILLRGMALGEGIRISVSDTGIGINEEEQKKIFERFYRVDKARSRAVGGTGLGLSIAAYIVEKHGGTIKVESREDVGTEMIVLFPPIIQDKGEKTNETD